LLISLSEECCAIKILSNHASISSSVNSCLLKSIVQLVCISTIQTHIFLANFIYEQIFLSNVGSQPENDKLRFFSWSLVYFLVNDNILYITSDDVTS
jgi:hypothetical protein